MQHLFSQTRVKKRTGVEVCALFVRFDLEGDRSHNQLDFFDRKLAKQLVTLFAYSIQEVQEVIIIEHVITICNRIASTAN